MIGQASNPMLAQAEQGIMQKTPQNLQGGLSKVVHAGLMVMYSPKLADQRNQRIAAMKDPAKDAGEGAARMISNLYQQSNKTMPTDLVVPASMIFAFEWLDLLAKAGKADITPDLIATTTQAVADSVLPLMGITKDKIAGLLQQAKAGQGAQPPGAPAGAPPAAPAPKGIIASAQGAA